MPARLNRHSMTLAVIGPSLFLVICLFSVNGTIAEGMVLVNLGDDIATQEDSSITFNSAVSYTGTKGLTYAWTFGDGTGSSAQRPSHTYTMAGNYTVTLTVTDSDGISDADSIFMDVLNVRPIADAGGDKTVSEGTTVTFDGSNSWDTSSDLPLLTYEWDFGDGTATTASKDNKVLTHTYAEAGVFVVRLVVRDDDWTESNFALLESQLITVNGSATGNGTVTFTYITGGTSDSNGTSDDNMTARDIYWDFGDGSYAQGANVTHTYAEDGVYIATLIITDAFGAMSVHHILVTVLNSPPTADAGSDVSGYEDETLTFTGGGSDPGGGPMTYSWAFGDGDVATGQNVTHSYPKQGTYTVTLTVMDSDGLTDTDTCTATITNVDPVAGLTSNHTTEEGDVIGFYGTTTTDTPSDLPLLVYIWDFGDGTTGAGSMVSHAYRDEGTYTVTLTVTDDDLAVDTAIMTFVVDNAVPVASIDSVTCPDDPILSGDIITFVGSGTDKGVDDTLTYGWDFDDGTTATTATAAHAFSSSGTYSVELTVTDNDGASHTVSTTVTVETLENVVESGQELVEEAPTSSFSKPQDQTKILDLFEDLMDSVEAGDLKKASNQIHVLDVRIGNKVTDADLKADLLALLENLDNSI